MVNRFRLALFALFLVVNGIFAVAPLEPQEIKQLVERRSTAYSTDAYGNITYYDAYGNVIAGILSYEQIAKNVLADTVTLKKLLNTYTFDGILNWKNGDDFLTVLNECAHDNAAAKTILDSYTKIYIQKKLSFLWDNGLSNLTTSTTLHAFSDVVNTYAITTDITTKYKQYLKRIAPLLCSLIKEEKELNDKGYFVFFHGQRWKYLLGEKLFTDLWALTKHKNRPKNYIFPHVRINKLDPEKIGTIHNRTSILKKGADWGDNDRGTLLFVTNSLFSNYYEDDYCSALHYFLKNYNYEHVSFSLEDIFDHYNLSHLYKKYMSDIKDLEKHYNAAQTLGTILRVAIPKTMVQDYCFRTDAGEVRECNIKSFLEEMQKKPTKFNNEEFCIVMLDEAMNPEGRILIKAYHCAEQTEWQKFEAGYEKLIQQIAKEIKSSK